ncbi:hypothetical protein PR048_027282 [Dryococelus australis]|uniref:Uncharacterized protein n=1 Tax=Dryococelus australis TaxID=614101 RepID=A0ABQ9GF13_9NEOP|nr:hypothetical protein PR048_027282 [Dryococelus australis]
MFASPYYEGLPKPGCVSKGGRTGGGKFSGVPGTSVAAVGSPAQFPIRLTHASRPAGNIHGFVDFSSREGSYMQHNDNTARQFRALRLEAMGDLMRVAVSPLTLPRLSASKAEKSSSSPGMQQGQGNGRSPRKPHRPAASFGTIPTCYNPGSNPVWNRARFALMEGEGRGGIVVRLLASHQGEQSYIPGGVTPGFSHVGIAPDDVAGRRVFSGISRFPPPLHSGTAPCSPRFTLISSQNLKRNHKVQELSYSALIDTPHSPEQRQQKKIVFSRFRKLVSGRRCFIFTRVSVFSAKCSMLMQCVEEGGGGAGSLADVGCIWKKGSAVVVAEAWGGDSAVGVYIVMLACTRTVVSGNTETNRTCVPVVVDISNSLLTCLGCLVHVCSPQNVNVLNYEGALRDNIHKTSLTCKKRDHETSMRGSVEVDQESGRGGGALLYFVRRLPGAVRDSTTPPPPPVTNPSSFTSRTVCSPFLIVLVSPPARNDISPFTVSSNFSEALLKFFSQDIPPPCASLENYTIGKTLRTRAHSIKIILVGSRIAIAGWRKDEQCVSEEFWEALNIEVLRPDEGKARAAANEQKAEAENYVGQLSLVYCASVLSERSFRENKRRTSTAILVASPPLPPRSMCHGSSTCSSLRSGEYLVSAPAVTRSPSVVCPVCNPIGDSKTLNTGNKQRANLHVRHEGVEKNRYPPPSSAFPFPSVYSLLLTGYDALSSAHTAQTLICRRLTTSAVVRPIRSCPTTHHTSPENYTSTRWLPHKLPIPWLRRALDVPHIPPVNTEMRDDGGLEVWSSERKGGGGNPSVQLERRAINMPPPTLYSTRCGPQAAEEVYSGCSTQEEREGGGASLGEWGGSYEARVNTLHVVRVLGK